MPLNRTLRPRKRRLPPPPQEEALTKKSVSTYSSTSPVNAHETARAEITPIISESTPEQLDVQSVITSEKSIQTNISLYSELTDVLREGIDKKLVSPSLELSQQKVDYSQIKKRQLKRAVEDYEAAGFKLAEAGLFSNAAISFGCAVLAELMAENSIKAASDEFKKIKSQVNSRQIHQSSFFGLLEKLIAAYQAKEKHTFIRQLERLKHIETFSSDDQELIANALEYLAKVIRTI